MIKKSSLIILASAALALPTMAQQWHEGDIEWINSTEFASNVEKWSSSYKLSDDDNFFISRVRPKLRFRNTATQIREDLKEGVNDRRLLAWLPVNIHEPGNTKDCLPTGIFDQEVFTMWSYVDHWGSWAAPMGQIPAGLSDVAHKNGVAVSSVGSVPFGAITSEWSTAIAAIGSKLGNEAGGMKAAKFLAYYGHDGVGYNSEFSGARGLGQLRTFHQYLMKSVNEVYNEFVPGYNLAENLWYDGTNDNGSISFDNGLGNHNILTWGPKGEERTSLFFNYNWDNRGLLDNSESNAETLGKGRNTLYLYCGLNMQGGEPSKSDRCWDTFAEHNFGIGLWGAHRNNMFFEGRGTNGTTPDAQQNTYQQRIENWFTGGTHNPANCPVEFSGSTSCSTNEKGFHGMSTFMSARSTLSWDLSEEAFVSYFSTGNGKFFNWNGERQNDNEWYNLGVQDFMPTWRWWWTNKFLGKTAQDVPANGLSANLSWNEAWVGGSSVRITGSTSDAEYLHLFKTNFELKYGDVIKVVYKLANGSTKASLVMSVNGDEANVANEIALCDESLLSDDSEWHTVSYTVKRNDALTKSPVAVIALKFENAKNADIYFGEISIKRGTLAAPVKPEVTKAQVLRNHYNGVDAKIIFNVPNDKPAGTVCYNDDVKASFFKIWSQEEGGEPVLSGITTSWAAMAYSVPFEGNSVGEGKIRFGVEAVSLDHNTTSEIAWSDYIESGNRSYSDQISVDKTTITPNETFTLKAVDDKRAYKWEIWTAGDDSRKVVESNEELNTWTCDGISEMGTYDVHIVGDNNTGEPYVTYNNFIVVTNASAGRLPQILSITANKQETSIEVESGAKVTLEYTGREANGIASRGIKLEEKFFGVRANELMSGQFESFSIAGWLKITNLPGDCVWIDIRQYDGKIWPRNNWGWLWTNIKSDGTLLDFHHDMTQTDGDGKITNPLVYDFQNGKATFFNPGQWTHFAFTFERDQSKCRSIIYINGKKIESKWYYYTNTNDDYIADPYTNEKYKPSQQGTTEDYVQASKWLNLNSYISVGGTRHTGRGGGLGFTGVLDDFQVWDHAMTQEEVNASMKGLDGNNLPAGVLGFWDFEGEPDDNNQFVAKGRKAGALAGYYSLAEGSSEGEGLVSYEVPTFTAGCPFIPGVDYEIATRPEWIIRKTEITENQGNDKAGSAVANFKLDGEYTANLTLSNDLGSDTKQFQFIKVGNPTAIEGVEANNSMRTYTVDGVLYLEVAEDGNYDVQIFDIEGRLVASKSQFVEGGNYMRLNFGGQNSVYVVNVNVDGKKAKAFKVVNK